MQLLERVHLVQFFLFEAQTLELDATSAIIAPNGETAFTTAMTACHSPTVLLILIPGSGSRAK